MWRRRQCRCRLSRHFRPFRATDPHGIAPQLLRSGLRPLRLADRSLLPAVQGGMGIGVSAHRLAGHVAAEGGVGTLSSVDMRRHHPDLMERTRYLGAAAVQFGTPFAVSLGGDAHPEFKGVLAEATDEDLLEFISVAGLPARAVLLGADVGATDTAAVIVAA